MIAINGSADVVVIGGGVMGLFTAYHLAQQGAGRIVLLEKSRIGAGSSGKSGAILRQHYSHEITVKLSRDSLKFFKTFEQHHGIDIGFTQTGMAFICHAKDRACLEANVSLQKNLGVNVELLDAPQLRDMEPRAVFDDDVIGALETDAAFIDPQLTLEALAHLCQSDGVDVRQGVGVVDILVNKNQQIEGVKTTTGETIETSTVINCGGPWAGILCARLGIDVPLKAIRPQQAYFSPSKTFGQEKLIWGDLLTGMYWKPEPAGWTRVGKMSYEGDEEVIDPDNYDEGVSRGFIEFCRKQMGQRIPDYRQAISWGGCGALYTVTPDAHALIGEVPGIDGFYLVSGFSGHGFKMGPAVGRGVAAMITGGDPGPFDASFFAIDRFERGQPVTSAYAYGILG